MADLALEESLAGELRLYDIDPAASRHNEGLGKAFFSRPEGRESRPTDVAMRFLHAKRGSRALSPPRMESKRPTVLKSSSSSRA